MNAPLTAAAVDAQVWQLRPDYQALLVEADGLRPGPSDAASEAVLTAAERAAAQRVAGREPADVPEIAAWRTAYRSFGAKPQRTRPSVEALLRRLDGGLPRVDRITDIYNAVSVAHLLPLGGEDLAAYAGPPRLVRARGDETFDTTVGGRPIIERPDVGEVVWRDDAGVTCRRWNWRQCTRTRLTTTTTRAIFFLDWLPAGDPAQSSLEQAGQALVAALTTASPGVRISTRQLSGPAGLR